MRGFEPVAARVRRPAFCLGAHNHLAMLEEVLFIRQMSAHLLGFSVRGTGPW
ncbi:MAG: hypothetical protein M1115_03255 [Actinobacteria bacterium]|nr:hypothetical protein [Actinomycetota bacterium]